MVEVNGPEDVEIVADSDAQQGQARVPGSVHSAESRGLQRQPDGDEPVRRDGHDQPGGQVQAH